MEKLRLTEGKGIASQELAGPNLTVGSPVSILSTSLFCS